MLEWYCKINCKVEFKIQGLINQDIKAFPWFIPPTIRPIMQMPTFVPLYKQCSLADSRIFTHYVVFHYVNTYIFFKDVYFCCFLKFLSIFCIFSFFRYLFKIIKLCKEILHETWIFSPAALFSRFACFCLQMFIF